MGAEHSLNKAGIQNQIVVCEQHGVGAARQRRIPIRQRILTRRQHARLAAERRPQHLRHGYVEIVPDDENGANGALPGVVADDGPPVVGALERVHQQHEPGARRAHRLMHLYRLHVWPKKNVELCEDDACSL